jgi:hypothetical protein
MKAKCLECPMSHLLAPQMGDVLCNIQSLALLTPRTYCGLHVLTRFDPPTTTTLPQVMSVISLLEEENPTPQPARSPLVSGTWRLVWSQQAEDASPLQKWGSAQAR